MCIKGIFKKKHGGDYRMKNIQLDNVFCSVVNEDYVEIKAGFCDELKLKKERITDKDVEEIKSIKVALPDYKILLRTILTAAIQLEEEHNLDLGLKIEKSDEHVENKDKNISNN